METKKAILINVANKKFTYIDLSSIDDYYKYIGNGCTTFAAPIMFDNNDAIFVDDEAFFHDIPGGFIAEGWAYPLIGNALIVGGTEEGDSDDVKLTIEEAAEIFSFIDKEKAQAYVDIARDIPPTIVSF